VCEGARKKDIIQGIRVYISVSLSLEDVLEGLDGIFECVAVCLSVLQCVAVCCSVLQEGTDGIFECVAVCCSVL